MAEKIISFYDKIKVNITETMRSILEWPMNFVNYTNFGTREN
jgi:hypothetical protein